MGFSLQSSSIVPDLFKVETTNIARFTLVPRSSIIVYYHGTAESINFSPTLYSTF